LLERIPIKTIVPPPPAQIDDSSPRKTLTPIKPGTVSLQSKEADDMFIEDGLGPERISMRFGNPLFTLFAKSYKRASCTRQKTLKSI
jgi:hypothetical protein